MRDVIFPNKGQASYEKFGYSAAVKSGGFLFVSGQVGTDEVGAPIRMPSEQFDVAFANLGEVLNAAGCGFDDIVDVTSFHVNMYEYFDDFAAAKQKVFPKAPFPNWTAVGVVNLALPDLFLEIKAIARLQQV
ncbi:RidA family protein [Ruegeria sp. MALMAid1280]|uniref:RidA family protein n=1 Tax=Ruegeria sp. MALMAid1280 TaxID=3411634 RepID=UPI003BA1DEB5